MRRIFLREANRILKRGCEPGIQKLTKPLYDRVKGKDPVTKMQYVDMHLWLVHDILMKGDKMGMANSLEVRVPFLDKKVLELAETLPLDYKVRSEVKRRKRKSWDFRFRSVYGFGRKSIIRS